MVIYCIMYVHFNINMSVERDPELSHFYVALELTNLANLELFLKYCFCLAKENDSLIFIIYAKYVTFFVLNTDTGQKNIQVSLAKQ